MSKKLTDKNILNAFNENEICGGQNIDEIIQAIKTRLRNLNEEKAYWEQQRNRLEELVQENSNNCTGVNKDEPCKVAAYLLSTPSSKAD